MYKEFFQKSKKVELRKKCILQYKDVISQYEN